ncbi:putative transmembrane protein, partial [Toxoplasma gondii CAST]
CLLQTSPVHFAVSSPFPLFFPLSSLPLSFFSIVVSSSVASSSRSSVRCVSREPLPFTALFPLGGCVFFLARRLHRPRAFSLALELLRFLSLDFFVSALRLLSAFVFLRRCGGSREKRLCSRISELSRERQQQTAEKDERRDSAHCLPLATSQIRKEREPLRRAVHEQTVNTLTDENKTKERKDRAERKGERRAADPPHSSGALWARRCR